MKSRDSFEEEYAKIEWVDEHANFNCHSGIPEDLPVFFSKNFSILFSFVKFFQRWIKPIAAECLATFMLVFWACMLQPISPTISSDPSWPLIPALAAGINLTIIITMFWDICIIQFNPCMTIAFCLSGSIPWRLCVPNIISQCLGAYLAALAASVLRGSPVGMIPISEESDLHAIFWAEFLFSFMMALVALMAVMDPSYSHSLTPLVVGLTVTQGVFGGWFIGAGCMNPARVFGPAAVSGDFNYHWIWWLSEILGASFAVLVEMVFFAPIKINEKKSTSNLVWWRALLVLMEKKFKNLEKNENFVELVIKNDSFLNKKH